MVSNCNSDRSRPLAQNDQPKKGPMTTNASLPSAFLKAAVKFNVAESDFLLMESSGINTFESLTYRMPKAENLEEFMHGTILPGAAFKQADGTIVTFARTPVVTWREFQIGEDAATIRKLWSYSKEVCKADLEAMTSGETDKPKQKVNVAASTAMEQSAVRRGMPTPVSDVERPALFTLTRAAHCLTSPGASFEYLVWEMYMSAEEEGRMIRSGRMPKGQAEIVVGKGDKLALQDKANDPPTQKITELDQLRRCLDIRARTMAMIEAAEYATYRALTDRYLSKMQATTAEGMRSPTINEIRRFDRVMHEDILRWISRDTGDLDNAVKYHLENDGLPLWRLLDAVVESLPDQGVERNTSAAQPRGTKRKQDAGEEASDSSKDKDKKKTSVRQKKKCFVCGKRHEPLCLLTPEVRKKMREDKKAKDAERKKKNEKEQKKQPAGGGAPAK